MAFAIMNLLKIWCLLAKEKAKEGMMFVTEK